MQIYIELFGKSIPSYGLMIVMGVIVANFLAVFVLRYTKQDFNDFVILESCCMLGAFVGAKLLYLLVSFRDIDWQQMLNPQYFNAWMQSGFVFYGGLIGGLVFVYAASIFYKIEPSPYVRNFVFLIPLIHAFGRVGCFMAGCCYGKPYDGPGAVIFPENSFAISGVRLFPVQLVEASLLLVISMVVLALQLIKNWYYTIETYVIMYAALRFGLEKLRYDDVRGYYGGLSTSQWISIALLIVAVVSIVYNTRRRKKTT